MISTNGFSSLQSLEMPQQYPSLMQLNELDLMQLNNDSVYEEELDAELQDLFEDLDLAEFDELVE